MPSSPKESTNKVINELLIDTVKGDCLFQIIEGNILADTCDLLVTTVYKDETSNSSGDLYQSIIKNKGLNNVIERKVIPIQEDKYIGYIHHADQSILTVHPNLIEGEYISSTDYKELVKATFSSLAALEYEGYNHKEIALPVLIRKGITNDMYLDALKWLIHFATKFLRYSEHARVIKYYIYHAEEVSVWNDRMEELLGTKGDIQPPSLNHQIYIVQQNILKCINSFSTESKIWNPHLLPIKIIVENEVSVNYSLLLIEAANLIDTITCDLYKLPGMIAKPFTLTKTYSKRRIAELKEERVIVDWYTNYILTIKKLSEHQYFDNLNKQTEEEKEAQLLFLSMLNRILSMYRNFYQDYYNL